MEGGASTEKEVGERRGSKGTEVFAHSKQATSKQMASTKLLILASMSVATTALPVAATKPLNTDRMTPADIAPLINPTGKITMA